MRTRHLLLALVALLWWVPAGAEDAAEDSGCCMARGRSLPLAAVAEAVVTAGDKPLWVLPDDPSRLDFELEGVCIEHLVNGLLKAQKLRAKDCGKSFGLFGLDVPADKATCDNVAAPKSELPPGHLEGWALTGVFTQAHGERMAALSGPEGQVYILSGNAALASEGTMVEGLADEGLVVIRGGISTLDGTLAKTQVVPFGEAAALTCVEIPPEEAPEEKVTLAQEEAAMAAGDETADEKPAGEKPAEDETAEGEGTEGEGAKGETDEPTGPVFACEGFVPDFIQRPLPTEIVDDPAYAGKEIRVELEFGPEGWVRRIVGVDCDEGCRPALAAAMQDWRIVPVEVAPGTFGRVRTTVTLTLEILCR